VFTAFSFTVSILLVPDPASHLHPSDDGASRRREMTGAAADPHASDDGVPNERFRSAVLFLGIAVLIGVDLVEDWQHGSEGLHLGLESIVLVLAAAGLWLLRDRVRRERAARAPGPAGEASAAAESWRRDTEALAAGLGRAIDSQFQQWRLTEAEREVALLLLKGLSLREIAGLRETSERTVRQQSLAVYRKAGLAGRAELSAYFLEDLLAPPAPTARPR
jgi:DNA-binding CsgD family transcriptional regulator